MALASGSERFRFPKTSSEETGLVKDTVPPSTKYKNKWAVNIFAEWQSLREVKVPVLDCGGVFLRLRATQGLRSEWRHSCNGRTVAEVLVVQIRDGGNEKVGRKIPSKERVWNHLFCETSFGGEKLFTVSKEE